MKAFISSMVSKNQTLKHPNLIYITHQHRLYKRMHINNINLEAHLKVSQNNCTLVIILRKRHQSQDIYSGKKSMGNTRYGSKPARRQSDECIKMDYLVNSSLSQYGTNLVKNLTSMQLLDQNRVFEKQEKQFNIISYQPKAYTPRLKNYPRLTLEDKIIEKRGPSQLQ